MLDSGLPGLLTEGNDHIDRLVIHLDALSRAIASHQLFRQGARALAHSFVVAYQQPQEKVRAYPDCQRRSRNIPKGEINPGGLHDNEIL